MYKTPVLGIGIKKANIISVVFKCRGMICDKVYIYGKANDQEIIKREYSQDPSHIEFLKIFPVFLGLDKDTCNK
jgi:hypothetical protein